MPPLITGPPGDSQETGMGTPPVFCVGRTQGSSRADTGEFFSDTGEFEGEFVLMGGVPGRIKQGVFLYAYERPQYIEMSYSGPRAFGAWDTC